MLDFLTAHNRVPFALSEHTTHVEDENTNESLQSGFLGGADFI